MATLASIIFSLQSILQDAAYTEPILTEQINGAVANIAAGIRMPNGETSPPLPDLYTYASVSTSTTLPYVLLPTNYQRAVFNIYDDTMYRILAPRGGDYYAFSKFLKQVNKLDFSEQGAVYMACIKGSKLYYQGIPSSPYVMGLHYYRKPTLLAAQGDVPECIPDHLQASIIKHYVIKDLFGEKIEDGQDNTGIGTKYHTTKFFEDMIDLVDFIGRDAEPMYYGSGGFEDRGACDG
jgi:hypothetical protein